MMSTHLVSASVVVWAIRYTLSHDDYVVWDGIRLARTYAPQLDRGYRKVLANDISTWLNTHLDADPVLRQEWEAILADIDLPQIAVAS